MLETNESVKTIQEYSKTHTLEETVAYFCGGEGNDLVEWAYSIMPKKIAEAWKTVRGEVETEDDTQETGGVEIQAVTLKMYTENGKAVYEYDGLNEDGQQVKCKGEFKSRDFAVKLARCTAERCNQFKRHLIFEHGREIDGPVTMEGVPIGDFCLSKEAYDAIHEELQKAAYQSEWGGFRRNWNFS